MNLWAQSMDELSELAEIRDLTVDQRIALLQIQATLSVSQEISQVWDVLQRVEDEGWGKQPKKEPGRVW